MNIQRKGQDKHLDPLDHQSIERHMSQERQRINRLNNGFASQKELVQAATPSYNTDIHNQDFTNIVPIKTKTNLAGKHSSVFLPPINKESLENLRKKSDLIIVENSASVERGGKKSKNLHMRKNSETERQRVNGKPHPKNKNGGLLTQRGSINNEQYISAFEGAHVSMPKYTDTYQSVKNLAPVRDCLKP